MDDVTWTCADDRSVCCDGVEFEAALVEMVIRHRNRQSTGEPDGEFLVLSSFLACLATVMFFLSDGGEAKSNDTDQ